MEGPDDRASLDRAVEFLEELEEDRRTAPPEFQSVTETYVPRLLASILKFRERLIARRELEAHMVQIRLSYARDLQRLLAPEPPPTSRWVRAGA